MNIFLQHYRRFDINLHVCIYSIHTFFYQVKLVKIEDTVDTAKVVTEESVIPVEKRRHQILLEAERHDDVKEVTTVIDREVKVVKKVVKKYSGEPPRFVQPIQPQVRSVSCTMYIYFNILCCKQCE